MIIYKTTNKINGKIYIGLDSRNNPKYLGSGTYIKSAIKKYGKENFTKEILQECNSVNELKTAEIYWIKQLNSKAPNGYNLTNGGDGCFGYKHTKETRQKLHNIGLGKQSSNKGKHHSLESKMKMSVSHIGKKQSVEHKNKISIALKGNRNKETSNKITETKRKNGTLFHSEQTKKKIGNANKISLLGNIPWNKGITLEEKFGTKIANEIKTKSRDSHTKYIYNLISPNNIIYTNITNISIFCKENNLNWGCLEGACRRNRNKYKKWIISRRKIKI